MSYIYHIYTVPETKHYIGKETVEGKRWNTELKQALGGSRLQPKFFNWIREYYGNLIHTFHRETLQVIDGSRKELNDAECFWIAKFRAEVGDRLTNLTEGGDGVSTGNIPWNKGKKTGPNPKHAAAIRGRRNPKVSLALRGRAMPLIERERRSLTMKGRKRPVEVGKKISLVLSTQESKKRMSDAQKARRARERLQKEGA